jgi:hypothetical protein
MAGAPRAAQATGGAASCLASLPYSKEAQSQHHACMCMSTHMYTHMNSCRYACLPVYSKGHMRAYDI